MTPATGTLKLFILEGILNLDSEGWEVSIEDKGISWDVRFSRLGFDLHFEILNDSNRNMFSPFRREQKAEMNLLKHRAEQVLKTFNIITTSSGLEAPEHLLEGISTPLKYMYEGVRFLPVEGGWKPSPETKDLFNQAEEIREAERLPAFL